VEAQGPPMPWGMQWDGGRVSQCGPRRPCSGDRVRTMGLLQGMSDGGILAHNPRYNMLILTQHKRLKGHAAG
jgi:hypothetical protein